MRSFEVPDATPTAFVQRLRSELAAKDYDRYVALDLDGADLVVELRWMGTTRFFFRIQPADDGFRAEFLSKSVSPLHAAFAHRFDEYFEKALEKVGGRPV
jgi:hypothetical protein